MESPLFRVSAALGIHLIVYCAIGAGLAFGLYALLQPSCTPNSGLAVYKPPPAAVVTYGKRSPATTGAEPIAPVEQRIAPVPLGDPEPVTTGRSTPEPENGMRKTWKSRALLVSIRLGLQAVRYTPN